MRLTVCAIWVHKLNDIMEKHLADNFKLIQITKMEINAQSRHKNTTHLSVFQHEPYK